MDLDELLQLATAVASEGDVRARKSKEVKTTQQKEKKLRKATGKAKKNMEDEKDQKEKMNKKQKLPKKSQKRSRDDSSPSPSSASDDGDGDSDGASAGRSKKRARPEKSTVSKPSASPPLLHIPPQTGTPKGVSAPTFAATLRKQPPIVSALYFKCATCRVEASGESSFIEHVKGSKHRKANNGQAGFSGLVPNSAGTIPPLTDPLLRAAALRFNPAFLVDGTDAAGQALPPNLVALHLASEASGKNSVRTQAAVKPLLAVVSGPWAPPAHRVDVPAHTLAAVQYFLGGAAGSSGDSNSPHSAADSDSEPESERDGGDDDADAEVGTAKVAERAGRGRGCSRLTPPRVVVPQGGYFRHQREGLPVFAHREALLSALNGHRTTHGEGSGGDASMKSGACVIEGETGSGKTTQVPQYLLEDAAAKRYGVSVVCTQPRRISAISVAERVASERGEKVGDTVGYAIRGETRAGPNTKLLFCTTGLLLRRLESDPLLTGTTHVLVDEVHERSLESDFLLLALKKILAKQRAQQQSGTCLSVGLMSATMPGHTMAAYFACPGACGGGQSQSQAQAQAQGQGKTLPLVTCPRVSFPGRAFPVAALHLEHALALLMTGKQTTKFRVDPSADWARSSHAAMQRSRQKQAQATATQNNRGGSGSSSSAAVEAPMMFGATASEVAARFPTLPCGVHGAMANLDEDAVNVSLIVALCAWYKGQGGVARARLACRKAGLGSESSKGNGKGKGSSGVGRAGGAYDVGAQDDEEEEEEEEEEGDGKEGEGNGALAVLVFLPGTREIKDVQDALRNSLAFSGGDEEQKAWVLPLHGGLPPDEQRKVFERPPYSSRSSLTPKVSEGKGGKQSARAKRQVVKVVLATNVAETSITIDDVGFVIDSGRVKEERYYPDRRMAALEDVWTSHASAKQRRGRAGRVGPGLAVHLFPSDAGLKQHSEPEVRRVALEQLVLRIKALGLRGSAARVCDQLVEPPEGRAVAAAVRELAAIGALKLSGDDSARKGTHLKTRQVEELTALGASLTQLPVDCRLGKLLLLGVSLECVDETLTAAAALSSRSPFLSPPDAREQADASKRAFARDAAPSKGVPGEEASKDEGADTDTGRLASDVLAAVRAYREFDALGNNDRGCVFARERLLSIKTLQQMAVLKRQLLEALSSAGLRGRVVPPGLRQSHLEYLGRRGGPGSGGGSGSDGCKLALAQWQVNPQRLSGSDCKSSSSSSSSSSDCGKRRGDWTCPRCKSNVFASKSTCFRCKEPKPRQEEEEEEATAAATAEAAEEQPVSAPSAELLAALVGAALFPQVAYVEAPRKKKSGAPCAAEAVVRDPDNDDESVANSSISGSSSSSGGGGGGKAEASKASVHPSSVAARVNGKGWEGLPFAAYHERVLTTKVYMRDVTPLPPLALPLLCGGSVVVVEDEEEDEAGKGPLPQAGGGGKSGGGKGRSKYQAGGGGCARWCTLVVDGWLRLQVPAAAAPAVLAARKQVGDRLRGLVTRNAQEAAGKNRGEGGGLAVGEAAGKAGAEAAVGGLVAALSALVEMKASAVVVPQPGAHRPNKHAQKRAKKRPAVAARKLRRGEAKQGSGSIRSIQSSFRGL